MGAAAGPCSPSPVSPARSRRPAPETAVHPHGQIWRHRDAEGRLERIELRSASGKQQRIVATFDWKEEAGERKAVGPNVHLGYFYSAGAEHVHTTWDDEPAGGTPIPFASWVKQVEDEFERRARTGQ